ncbi:MULTISPECIES: hypothetical protein [unclassified Pseudomonas]|uniref:hypothetical protein n=1 Tax=unclassified Pseudomonas TaxID=196821 RepID=UPI0030DDB469
MSVTMLPSSTYEVRQNEIAMVSRRKGIQRRETLFTQGLNPCIGVLLWDDNWVVLGHLHDSTQGSFEASYAAVLMKMRTDSGGLSVISGGILYHKNLHTHLIDHRDTLRNYLRDNGVVVQTDTVSSNDDPENPALRVAVSRSGKYATPHIKTTMQAPGKPLAVTRAGPYAQIITPRLIGLAVPAITIITGQDQAETYDHGSFTALARRYGL